MDIIADLQLHSKYSQAVSKYMDLFEIERYAKRKGIGLVTTGDWQHPLWYTHLVEELEEKREGIYQLRSAKGTSPVEFILVSELSCIYRHLGRGRRVHHLIFSPSLEVSKKVQHALLERGYNLAADGRPIIPLSSHDLLALLLEIDSRLMLLPAHVWTPWFGLFGSKSGYDSLQECFEDLSEYVYAVETGLSSDPLMNWRIKELDTRQLVSFSDAHSGPKMGREATVFSASPADFTYQHILDALQGREGAISLAYTIEYFPEEGKYHWTGHRACGVRYSPQEERVKGLICPVCHKPLTSGVEHRVDSLAARELSLDEAHFFTNSEGVTFVQDPERTRKPFTSLVPLLEILKHLEGGSKTRSERRYMALTDQLTEFDLLLHASGEDIAHIGGEDLAEAVRMIRQRKVKVDPGYDGVFGTVYI